MRTPPQPSDRTKPPTPSGSSPRRKVSARRGVAFALIVAAVLAGAFGPGMVEGWTAGPIAAGAATHPGVTPGVSVAGVASTLGVPTLAATTPSTFWSIDAQTTCANCISTNASTKAFLATTPFTWVRYGAGTDACNETTGTSYSDAGVASTGCAFSVSALKTWCNGLTPHCHAVLSLPGENNNSAEDANIAQYIVKTIGFQPDYWSIGNEPTGWTHYGIAWTKWRTTDASAPTPIAYAFDVKAAIAAVAAVDPGAKFIGLEAACSCNTAWFQDVVAVNGAMLSAIAYHSYPSTGSTTETVAQFLSPLTGSSNLTGSYAAVRAAISGHCTKCGTLPIFVNEYNAGPGWGASTLGGTYANAVFLAASVTQALTANVTQLTTFNLQTSSTTTYGFSLLNGRSTAGPTGILFSQFLRYLAVGTAYHAPISTTVPSAFAVLTKNSSYESLLVVNANLTHALALKLGLGFPSGVTGTALAWTSSQSHPSTVAGKIASAYSVPAESLLLLNVKVGLLPAAPTHPTAGPDPRILGATAASFLATSQRPSARPSSVEPA